MNHDELASKAANAIGVTPHSDMRPFVEQAVKWALSEAALSAAEPVATVAEMGVSGMRVLMPHPPGSADHLPIGIKLYAAPPAPSVAVKAGMEAVAEIRRLHKLLGAHYQGKNGEPNLSIADALEAALSAQVQDVAGWQPIDTAPKERQQRVLLTLPNGRVTEGWWGAAKYNRSKKEYDLAWVSSPYSGDVSPTHWMPLPAAPAKQEDSETQPVHKPAVNSGESGDE